MLLTSITEGILFLYTVIRYRMTHFGQLAALALLLLGLFQVAEYQICGGQAPWFWARIGLVAITLLPPLGVHLISLLTKEGSFMRISYASAAIFGGIFAFIPDAITGTTCGGNYIIFNTLHPLGGLYGIYYFGFLFLGLWKIGATLRKAARHERSLLIWMAIGYASFILPMGIVYSLSPATRAGVPSIMCGFAITLALILGLIVMPRAHSIRIINHS